MAVDHDERARRQLIHAFDRAFRRTRRAYELGRLRMAALRAGAASLLVACIALVALGRDAVAWAPLAFVVALVGEWRGGHVAAGARRGLAIGAASLAVPMSLLRPCCAVGMTMTADCCKPGACVAVGAAIGLVAALFLPRSSEHRRGRDVAPAAATALGVIAVAAMRCGPLFWGEALGLLGGIAGALAVSAVGRSLVAPRSY